MSRLYERDALEKDANSWSKFGVAGVELFAYLRANRERLRGRDVGTAAVYLVRVTTNRRDLLFNGSAASLPSRYLTWVAAVFAIQNLHRSMCRHYTGPQSSVLASCCIGRMLGCREGLW
jgi:hypothetical protein